MDSTSMLVLAAGAVVAAPAVSSIGYVRRALWPTLNGDGDVTHVALTFDDGPDLASTPAFIAALADLEVTATFFLLGRMVQRSPETALALVAAGHEVGVHGWDHRMLLARSPRSTGNDLQHALYEIQRTCGIMPRFYRPPYGVMSWGAHRHAARLGLTPVLWGAWGRDWQANATAESIRTSVRRGLSPGATVLLHDSDCTSTPGSWKATLSALPLVVDDIRGLGLEPGPLRDHGLVLTTPLTSTSTRTRDRRITST